MGAEVSTPAVPEKETEEQNASEGENVATENADNSNANGPSALVIVGPSGVGKGTLVKRLMQGSDQFGFSVSHTTRSPRPGEQHGTHYYFTTKELFAKEVAEGKFLEYAEVHNNLYGTSINAVTSVLESGRVCILDIDVQGARSVRKAGLKAIFVFIAPPSLEDLASRLAGRGTESVQQITRRLTNAKSEIESINEKGLYDYLLINDDFEEAVDRLKRIAARAAAGLPPEPGQVPARVVLEDAPLPDFALASYQQSAAARDQASASAAAAGGGENESDIPEEVLDPVPQEPSRPRSPSFPAVKRENGEDEAVEEDEEGGATSVSGSAASDSSNAAQADYGSEAESAQSVGGSPAALLSAGEMHRWRGKVALVTGASSGIGWATCEALALAGMHVVAVARRKERLEALQAHVHSLGVPPAVFLPVVCDITKENEVATLPRIAARRWPGQGIDVLVNNAGLSRNDASLFDGNIGSWVEMLSTNVLGTCMMARVTVQDMRRRNSFGHIINMVGLSGHRIPDGPQGGGFYCATKAAVRVITEGMRQEARGAGLPLRISGISPGMVETEFFQVRAFGDPEATRRATSKFKCLDPQDVARAILWCLSAPPHVEVDDIVVRPTEQLI